MKFDILSRFFALFAIAGLLLTSGCEKESGLEKAADDVGDAIEDAGDKVEDAVD